MGVQKAKALWKRKEAKEAGEEYYDPRVKTHQRKKRDKISTLEKNTLKDPIGALDKALNLCGKSKLKVSAQSTFGKVFFSNGCCWLPPKFVGKADLGGRLALLGPNG